MWGRFRHEEKPASNTQSLGLLHSLEGNDSAPLSFLCIQTSPSCKAWIQSLISFVHPFVHPFIQCIVTEDLLRGRHWTGGGGYRGKQQLGTCFQGFLGARTNLERSLRCAQNTKHNPNSWPGPTKSCMIWLLTVSLNFLITPCLSDYILITLASFRILKTLSQPFPASGTSHWLCLLHGSIPPVLAQRFIEASLPLSQSGFSQLLLSSTPVSILIKHFIAFLLFVFSNKSIGCAVSWLFCTVSAQSGHSSNNSGRMDK